MKKMFNSICILFLLLFLRGCYSMQQITKEEFKEYKGPGEISVLTKGEEIYQFNNGISIVGDTLEGNGNKLVGGIGIPFDGKIALDSISSIEVKEMEGGKTRLLIGTVIVAVPLILVISFMFYFTNAYK